MSRVEEIIYTNQFKKSYKRAKKQHRPIDELKAIVSLLEYHQPIPLKHRDHQLTGDLKEFRELHIQPDWLLRYKYENQKLILVLAEVGSHSEMFGN
jgi:mRNA interferase YafQ